MKRKEEREKASKNRADQYSHPIEWNECYRHFKEGAEWADRTMIDKACKWLKSNIENYYYRDEAFDQVVSIKNLSSDFIKAIEE